MQCNSVIIIINILRPFFHTKAQVRRYQQSMLDLILAHASRTECPSGSADPILVAFYDLHWCSGSMQVVEGDDVVDNGKVGDSKEDDTVGPFGLGERNDNG